jgi:hypothetical protein
VVRSLFAFSTRLFASCLLPDRFILLMPRATEFSKLSAFVVGGSWVMWTHCTRICIAEFLSGKATMAAPEPNRSRFCQTLPGATKLRD